MNHRERSYVAVAFTAGMFFFSLFGSTIQTGIQNLLHPSPHKSSASVSSVDQPESTEESSSKTPDASNDASGSSTSSKDPEDKQQPESDPEPVIDYPEESVEDVYLLPSFRKKILQLRPTPPLSLKRNPLTKKQQRMTIWMEELERQQSTFPSVLI